MANELHGLAACIYVDGVKFENAAGWTIGIVGEECEIVEFGDTWKELLRGVLAGGGTITAYHDQEEKILADLAQSTTTKEILLYPDCTDDSTYYQFDAWFDFEHTADVGSCQQQTSPFRVDGSVVKTGFECMLLKDAFTTADPAPMASPRICFPGPGQLTPNQTDGNFTVAGGVFSWPVQGTAAWGDQEWYALDDTPAPYARILGQVLKYRMRVTTADAVEGVWVGYSPDATPDDEDSSEHGIRVLAMGAGFDCHWGVNFSPALKDLWPALNGWAQVAVVLNPFDSNLVHWYPGTATDHSGGSGYGAHYFFRDETVDYPHNLLSWYCGVLHTSPLYPCFSNYESAGEADYVLIPCATYETPLLQPALVDTFTGTEDLGVHDPDYQCEATEWVKHEGDWDIAGGVCSPDNTAPAHAYHTCRVPDAWVEVVVEPNTDTQDIGLTLRESANTVGGHNGWVVRIRSGLPAAPDTWLDENIDGAVTNRDVKDVDYTAGTPYRLKARLLDERITVYVDDVEHLDYTTAWFNKHSCQHGMYASNHPDAEFDDFLILPVGSGLRRECFDNFDDTDAVRLNTTTTLLDGLPWVEDVGTWIIDNNLGTDQEADPDGTAQAHAHVVTTASNAWVTARALTAADEWVGVKVRQSADSMGGANFWYCEITNTADIDQRIAECRDGVHTARAFGDTDNAAQRWYIQVRCLDSDVRMWVDGTDGLGFATAEFNKTATWHGLWNNDDTNARFDQFRVTRIGTYGEYDNALDALS